MLSVTVLEGDGGYFRGVRLGPQPVTVGGCVTVVEEGADCDAEGAWYRVESKAPGSGRCPAEQRRSEDGEFCLRVLRPVEVDIDVDVPPLSTP